MKKKLLCILLSISFYSVFAIFTSNYPITLQQPDGTCVNCFITGDEYYLRIHDSQGYTLIRNSETGWIEYATLHNDSLIPSGYKVGEVEPHTVGLIANIDISAAKKNAIRRQFLDSTPDAPAQEPNNTNGYRTREGVLNNLVVYIRFSDDSEFDRDKNSIEQYFNSTTAGQSLFSYYRDISAGNFLLPSFFYPASTGNTIISYQDAHPRNFYLPYNAVTNPNGYDGDERREREHTLLHNALLSVQNEIEATFTGADLDYNNDGRIDNICFIVKGNASDWSTLLWPHRWSLYTYGLYEPPMLILGKRVWDYNFIIENHFFTASNGKQSVLVHETYHTLSAPDMYRYSDNTITPVGAWEVMASNTNPPQSSTAYVSYKYGDFVNTITEITDTGTYAVYQIWDRTQGHNIVYKLTSPTSTEGEFFCIEYRKKSNIVYESAIPGEGLIIYRINPSFDGNADGPPDEEYVYRRNGTSNTVNGNINQAHFSAQVERNEFSDYTNPPCFLTNGEPGLGYYIIDQISASGADSMTFHVGYITSIPQLQAGFFVNTTAGCSGLGVSYIDQSTGSPTSWHWDFGDGSYSTQQNPYHIYLIPGSYNASLTITKGPLNSTYTLTTPILVYPRPTVNYEVSPTMSPDVQNGAITVIATDAAEPYSYYWAEFPTVNSPLLTELANGIYHVTVTDANNCSTSKNIQITSVSINENSKDFKIYPNPADNIIKILFKKTNAQKVEIYNVLGNNVLSIVPDNKDKEIKIDVSNFSSGLYFIKIELDNANHVEKIIIK